MKPLLLSALFSLPLALVGQIVVGQSGVGQDTPPKTYSDSLFTPGVDPEHASPLTAKENLRIHLLRGVGPRSLAFDALAAGLNQWKDDPGKWGRGADGYAKRFGSEAGRNGVREGIGFGLDAALHTDPRIYRSSHTNFTGRFVDAISQVVVARTDSGHRTFAVANVSSAFAAGQIQTLWMPPNDAHVKDGLVNAGVMLMGDAIRDVAREFWPDVRRKLHHGE
jgi:hypothetical protein